MAAPQAAALSVTLRGLEAGVNPRCRLRPTGTGCARTVEAESYIRVTAAGRPGTGPAGPPGQEPEYPSPRQCLTRPLPQASLTQSNAERRGVKYADAPEKRERNG